MNIYFKQYRPFFIFLIKFVAVYAVLTIIYQGYLNRFDEKTFETDGFTHLVASQAKVFLNALNYHVDMPPHPEQASIKLILENVYVARVVEGCNALSVIILFSAFVVAFKGKWKHTVLFILIGSAFIHILNIIRIGLLSMALLRYPEYGEFLHGVVFPLFIYGVVFILWIIWVNKFSIYAEKST